jgi:hypothetical protein
MRSAAAVKPWLLRSHARLQVRRDEAFSRTEFKLARALSAGMVLSLLAIALSLTIEALGSVDPELHDVMLRPGASARLLLAAAAVLLAASHARAYFQFHSAPLMPRILRIMSVLALAFAAVLAAQPFAAGVFACAAIADAYGSWRLRERTRVAEAGEQLSRIPRLQLALAACAHLFALAALLWASVPSLDVQRDKFTREWRERGAEVAAANFEDPDTRARFLSVCREHEWHSGVGLRSSELLVEHQRERERMCTWLLTPSGDLGLIWRVDKGTWQLEDFVLQAAR